MLVIFILTNIAIFLGYFTIAKFIVPRLDIQFLQTKIGGLAFFALCAATHMELAYHAFTSTPILVSDFTSWHMLAVHIPQAIAVWFFTYGLHKEISLSRTFFELNRSKLAIKGIIHDLDGIKGKVTEEDLKSLEQALMRLTALDRRIGRDTQARRKP